MIRWSQKLYMDKRSSKKKDRLKQLIEQEKAAAGVYLILLAANEANLFDILSSNELLFAHYKRNDSFVVGIAHSRAAAQELLCRIVEDMYRETGRFRTREYFTF